MLRVIAHTGGDAIINVPCYSPRELYSKLSNRNIQATRTFHEVTKHSYTTVRSSPHSLDWDNRPMPYKIYPGAGSIALPRDLNLAVAPTLAVLSGEPSVTGDLPIDLAMVTRLLFCASGLTRRIRIGAEDYHFRAAPSAGALYPIELYLAAGEVEGLNAGLYHFSTADLRLRGLRRGDWRAYIASAAAMRPAVREARAVLVMSAIFWRSTWKYRARAYRYCFWDTGTILANLIAAANAEGLEAEVVTAFEDAPIEALIEADREREGLTCMVALGRTIAAGPAPELPPLELDTIPLSPKEVRYEDLVKIHTASRLTSADEVRTVSSVRLEPKPYRQPGVTVEPDTIGADAGLGLGETILRRGSTRVFVREEIGADELAAIMAASSAPQKTDYPRGVETYVIVNAVQGVDPGAYYYRAEGSFELLKRGGFRGEAGYLCLEQPLGADCSVLIVYMTDLERVIAATGNRGYRNLHLEAGLMGGRAYLAAYALGRGATGLTFYDDDTTKFFEPHATGMSPILMVAVGVPGSRAVEPARDDD
jgi:SagB-type dehydrogenase family enzyme